MSQPGTRRSCLQDFIQIPSTIADTNQNIETDLQSPIHTYIKGDVCIFVPSFWPNLLVDRISLKLGIIVGFDLTKNMGKKVRKMVTMVMGNSQIWYLACKALGATDLKLCMHIQLHSGSNMGWVPPGHTSSFPCAKLKMPKMVFQQKHLNIGN